MPTDLAVIRLSATPTPNRGHKQLRTLGADPVEISGINVLIQIVTLLLFQKPGSDILNPQLGVDLTGLLTKPVGSLQEHKADAAVMYSLLQEQVISMQRDEPMPDEERLTSLVLENITQEGTTFIHRVRITSAAGSSAVLNTKDLFV
jgi:hypothetical protein